MAVDARRFWIHGVGAVMLLLSAGLIYLVFLLWPDSMASVAPGNEEKTVVWRAVTLCSVAISNDLRVVLLVLLAGTFTVGCHATLCPRHLARPFSNEAARQHRNPLYF